jgi:hypothetical protein
MDILKLRFKLIYRDLQLLWQSPKEFIYITLMHSNGKVNINKYDPRGLILAKKIIAQIKTKAPGLKLHLIGSVGLKIAGHKDIDIFAECRPEDFDSYLPKLIAVLGHPGKRRKSFIEWNVNKLNYTIEFVLIDPADSRLKEQLRLFKLLNKPANKRKYEALKITANGIAYYEYDKRRLYFFNQLLK